MSDISKIDKNFVINTNIGKDDICFYNVRENKFKVYGVFWEDGKSPARWRGKGLREAVGVFGVLAELGEEGFGNIIPNFFPIVVAYSG